MARLGIYGRHTCHILTPNVLRLSTPRRRLRIDHLEVHERGWGRRRGDPEPYAPDCLRSLMPPIAVVGRSVLLALLAVEQLGPTLRIAGAQDPLWTPPGADRPRRSARGQTAATAPAGHAPLAPVPMYPPPLDLGSPARRRQRAVLSALIVGQST